MQTTSVIHIRNDHVDQFAELFNETAPPFLTAAAIVVQEKVIQLAPTDQGTFKNSIRVAPVTQTGGKLETQVYSEDLPIKVAVIELGRRKNKAWPPVDVITLWVKRVLRPPPEKLKSTVFFVRRKIAVKGILGRYVFEVAELVTRAKVEQILEVDLPNALAARL